MGFREKKLNADEDLILLNDIKVKIVMLGDFMKRSFIAKRSEWEETGN